MEVQFATNGITQDLTKFYHAVQALDASVLSEVSELITNPPNDGKYETLKTKILSEFQVSEEKRLKTLLSATELSNLRPSRLLKQMRDLAEGKVPEELLKSLWMRRLLTNIQAVLSTSEAALDRLATMADRIHDIVDSNVCSVESAPSITNTTAYEGQLCEIIKRLDRIETKSRSPSSRRKRDRSTNRSRSKSISADSQYCHGTINVSDGKPKDVPLRATGKARQPRRRKTRNRSAFGGRHFGRSPTPLIRYGSDHREEIPGRRRS